MWWLGLKGRKNSKYFVSLDQNAKIRDGLEFL
jgi:hypothetical protein